MAGFSKPLNRLSCVLCFVLSVVLYSSCQEGREAGDLFGQWRMVDSDTKYISFSGSVTKFSEITEGYVYGNFQHVGDSLFIQCYSIEQSPIDTTIIENRFGMRPFNDIRLRIERLGDDDLVLTCQGQTWSFYKY
jgi:hypothetical protein